jgi:hypothetical protein
MEKKMSLKEDKRQNIGQKNMSFAEQMKNLEESLFSDEESYLSEEEVVVVELPKKQIDLVDLCDNDSDKKFQRKQRDVEIQVTANQSNKITAAYPTINLDTDDEEDGSDYWEMESESEKSEDDEEDSIDDSDETWNLEEEKNLNHTDDETPGTRSRKKRRFQTSKNSDNPEFGYELGSSPLSPPSSNCPQ